MLVARKLVLKVAKRLAWLASFFLKPITIFRWTGILPFRTISYETFHPVPYRAQAAFTGQRPRSIREETCWTASVPLTLVMSHMLEIQHGFASSAGHVFDATGRLIQGASHKHREKVRRALVSSPYRPFPPITQFAGTVAVVTGSYQHTYFHWLFDILPRLAMLAETGKSPDKIYLQHVHHFQRETLKLLGTVSEQRLIDCNDVFLLSAPTLIVPCHQIMHGREFPAWVIHLLRDSFLPHAPAAESGAKRLYLSRATAAYRRVMNEAEILELLQAYGFIEVRLEELAFTDQVRLFRDADVVVAPHGSGLANLVFCAPGARVIELFPAAVLDFYFRLSQAVGLDYYFLTDRQGDPQECGLDDYTIGPEELRQTLALAGVMA